MNIRNPKFNRHNTIDLELEHPTKGWFPCTVSPDDENTKKHYAAALKMNPLPYSPPSAEEVLASTRIISYMPRYKFILEMINVGKITQAVGISWASGAKLPSQLTAVNPTIDEKFELLYAEEFHRTSTLIETIATAFDLSVEELDNIFGI